ncbi:hypothetical protein LTR05_003141 [Lithohypha guttulata]|uniref:Uncharacterized protein n=1 Tax=Lithohypha guttulata TaxID=1690604 RepID=A0AAN7Y889_9EURO|nr:hypothetical protein LTR05_003141 [Lithohypha guttulata]
MSGLNNTMDCSVAPATTSSDAGIAGTGILLAFIMTATLALLLSSYIVVSEAFMASSPRTISRKLLSGLSDQQPVQGIAIQALGIARIHDLVAYHFFIIWMLSLLSTATNFAALLALVQDFKRDWMLRWLRQAAMFVSLCLTIVFGVFILEVNLKSLPSTLPVGCIWEDYAKEPEEKGNNPLAVAGIIAVIASSTILFILGTWYLHLRKQVWGRFVQVLSLLVLFATAIAATTRVVVISQAFGTPSVQLSDENEKTWTFGQLLAMLMLVLPFISALEISRGELRVPSCEPEQIETDQVPLTSSGRTAVNHNRYSYQPNPFFK